MRAIILVGLLCLLVGLSQAQTEFVYNFDNIRRLNSYKLGWINNGTTVMFNFTTQGTSGTPLTFANLRAASGANFLETDSQSGISAASATPGTGSDVVCVDISGCTSADTTCVRSCDIISSNFYRFNVDTANVPTTNANPQVQNEDVRNYLFDVTSFSTVSGGPSNSSAVISSLYKNVEVFRDKVVKIIYADGFTNMSFTLSPVPGASLTPNLDSAASGANLALFAVTTITDSEHLFQLASTNLLSIATGTATPYVIPSSYFTVNYDAAQNNTLFYNGTSYLPVGYYALVVDADPAIINPFMRVTYDSYTYSCPYNQNYQDYYLTFQPCLSFINANGTNAASIGQPGFPCIVF